MALSLSKARAALMKLLCPPLRKAIARRCDRSCRTETYDVFAQEISKREQSEETLETAVVAIDVATVSAARVLAQRVEVTVKFEARLMSVRRDKNGETIDGGRTIPVIELWTFARDPRAQDPNWKLIATHAAG